MNRLKFLPNRFLDPNVWMEAEKADFEMGGHKEPWRDFWRVRGFRIELGEIDAYLSHHLLVRENVTLVRRDKDEGTLDPSLTIDMT